MIDCLSTSYSRHFRHNAIHVSNKRQQDRSLPGAYHHPEECSQLRKIPGKLELHDHIHVRVFSLLGQLGNMACSQVHLPPEIQRGIRPGARQCLIDFEKLLWGFVLYDCLVPPSREGF